MILEDIETLIAQAYVFKQQFYESPSHLNASSSGSEGFINEKIKKCISSDAISSCDLRKSDGVKSPCQHFEAEKSPVKTSNGGADAKNTFIVISKTPESKKKKRQGTTGLGSTAFPNSV